MQATLQAVSYLSKATGQFHCSYELIRRPREHVLLLAVKGAGCRKISAGTLAECEQELKTRTEGADLNSLLIRA